MAHGDQQIPPLKPPSSQLLCSLLCLPFHFFLLFYSSTLRLINVERSTSPAAATVSTTVLLFCCLKGACTTPRLSTCFEMLRLASLSSYTSSSQPHLASASALNTQQQQQKRVRHREREKHATERERVKAKRKVNEPQCTLGARASAHQHEVSSRCRSPLSFSPPPTSTLTSLHSSAKEGKEKKSNTPIMRTSAV
jgi:hypothetical protein